MRLLVRRAAVFLFGLACAGCIARSQSRVVGSADTGAVFVDTVFVAPPRGERAADRASILAAIGQIRPGGTIQFAPGTYITGELIRVAVPRVTLLGHPQGTTLRGCNAADFPDAIDVGHAQAGLPCNGLELTGGHQTVRNLTFEYTWHAIVLGCCVRDQRHEPRPGGHIVEGNTFRESANGIRVIGQWSEPAVIRRNRFINVFHAVGINGRTAHVLDNDVSAPQPERIPEGGHPSNAIGIACFADLTDCHDNVISGNRIEGHPDGILLLLFPGASARHNVIRNNTIVVRRVRFARAWEAIHVRSASDSTINGAALTLVGVSDSSGVTGTIEDNLIEGNRLSGAHGLGVAILRASRNRIVNNTISNIAVLQPFPGNSLGDEMDWGQANGSGIWVSPGSHENEIVGNVFADIAGYTVVLEGDRNRVERRSPTDAVRDLGSDNRVSGLTPR